MKTFSVIGCGEIGSRHLQGLLHFPEPVKIQVVEPSAMARSIAQARAEEVQCRAGTELSWHESMETIEPGEFTVIATTAVKRVDIFCRLLDQGHKRFLIEKMVCQSDQEYQGLLAAFKQKGAKGWINCYRRYTEFYKKLKLDLGSSPLHVSVLGGNQGLGCNAIHFLDLFAFLCADNHIDIIGGFFSDRLLPNKRSRDLIEFAGTIVAQAANGSTMTLTFSEASPALITVEVLGRSVRAFIDEDGRRAQVAREWENWGWQAESFMNLYSSQLTPQVAYEVLTTDQCNLASLEDSYPAHRELFSIFLNHLEGATDKAWHLCPIT